MKKILVMLGVIGLLCASASPLWAGGIINKSNLSADYFRSLTRHASTDAADIVAYNPAGVMKMENGFYTKLDALYIDKDYGNNVPNQGNIGAYPTSLISGENGDFTSDEPSLVPGFFTVYKQDKWAGFFAVTVPGGGGKVKYKDGDARTSVLGMGIALQSSLLYNTIDSAYLEADSVALGYTLGGAVAINNMLSLSAGVRYVDSDQKFKGNAVLSGTLPAQRFDVDLERTATGWGYFLGADISPLDDLNIGILYQSNTALDYKSSVTKDDPGITPGLHWADGQKEREDLPGILGLGISYKIIPQLRIEADYTRYLESNAKLEATRFVDAGDSWEVGLSLTYTFNPQWRASIGYLYTDIEGMDSYQLLAEAPELDAKTIGLGAVYSPTDKWQFSLGYTNVNYDSVTTDVSSFIAQRAPVGTEYTKEVWAISVGVQYRWF